MSEVGNLSAHILVVEDDPDLREAMAAALSSDGHRVETAFDGRAALDALAVREPDVLMLDVSLGAGPDGIELCRRARQLDADTYVMMLTARDAEADVVLALEAGADDYVTKPVGIAELRSRVRAAVRRLRRASAALDAPRRPLLHATLTVDEAALEARVQGVVVPLTRSELTVLAALIRAGGSVLGRRELLREIYGDDAYRDPHGIDVHVHHLRDKLAHAGGKPGWVVTVRGAGYRIGP